MPDVVQKECAVDDGTNLASLHHLGNGCHIQTTGLHEHHPVPRTSPQEVSHQPARRSHIQSEIYKYELHNLADARYGTATSC